MRAVKREILTEIVGRLVQEFDPEEIILFGSRAWGEPRPDSDYDILVVVSDSAERSRARAVRAHACLSELGIAKDVIVSTREQFDRLSGVPASLEAQIHDRGVVLHGRSRGPVNLGPALEKKSRSNH